jgi:hypothetical protein
MHRNGLDRFNEGFGVRFGPPAWVSFSKAWSGGFGGRLGGPVLSGRALAKRQHMQA